MILNHIERLKAWSPDKLNRSRFELPESSRSVEGGESHPELPKYIRNMRKMRKSSIRYIDV